jgi:hypothetical protein
MRIHLEVKDHTFLKGGDALKRCLRELGDGKWRLVVEKDRKTRSIRQNALMWVWLNIMGDNLGYDPEELHCTFKAMFLTDRSLKVPLVRSTTQLSTLNQWQKGL